MQDGSQFREHSDMGKKRQTEQALTWSSCCFVDWTQAHWYRSISCYLPKFYSRKGRMEV